MTHMILKRVLRMLNEIMHINKWIVTMTDCYNCFDKLYFFHYETLCMHACFRASSVTQSCPTLCDLMDWWPLGSSVHGIFQARILEHFAISYSNTTLLVLHQMVICFLVCHPS